MLLPVTAESVPYVALAVVCCLACSFFLFVLFHWMQDSGRSKKQRPAPQRPMVASHAQQLRKTVPQMLVSSQQPRVGDAHVARPRVVPLSHVTNPRAVSFQVTPIEAHRQHADSNFLRAERAAYERIANSIHFRRKA